MRDEISLKITNKADSKLIYHTFSYLKERLPVTDLAPLEERGTRPCAAIKEFIGFLSWRW